MWNKDLLPDAQAYALLRGLEITGPLGDGVDGNVWKVRGKRRRITWALKIFKDPEKYRRERDCYLRLAEQGISECAGFNIPVLSYHDDNYLAVEMSIVDRPFILDFAGAFLDVPPDFSEQVLAETHQLWEERYGDDFPVVQKALRTLERLGIYYLDVHRDNVALRIEE